MVCAKGFGPMLVRTGSEGTVPSDLFFFCHSPGPLIDTKCIFFRRSRSFLLSPLDVFAVRTPFWVALSKAEQKLLLHTAGGGGGGLGRGSAVGSSTGNAWLIIFRSSNYKTFLAMDVLILYLVCWGEGFCPLLKLLMKLECYIFFNFFCFITWYLDWTQCREWV